MKSLFYLSIVVSFFIGCHSSDKTAEPSDTTQPIDTLALRQELDSMFVLDQKYRNQSGEVVNTYGHDSPEMKTLWEQQERIDSSNVVRLQQIFDEVGGYPGISLLGVGGSRYAFFILQHAQDSLQANYYPLIKAAGDNNELSKGLVAMYTDRYLLAQGKPQIYGSQIRITPYFDSLAQQRRVANSKWPIADTTKIDSVRLWNGLGPLEEYLNGFGLSRWE